MNAEEKETVLINEGKGASLVLSSSVKWTKRCD